MLVKAGIPWQPIADLPADRKDGRDILVWATDISGPDLVTWSQGVWANGEGFTVRGISHYADINPPA